MTSTASSSGFSPINSPGNRGGILGRLSPADQCSAAVKSEKAAQSLILRLNRTMPLNDGYCMPALGFGTFSNVDSPDEMEDAVYNALEIGYRSLDCAEAYKNEEFIGKGLRRALKDGIVSRESVYITSKVWQTNHEAKRVREACLNSLKCLGLAYLDLYLMHWPIAWEYTNTECEPLIPLDENGRVAMSKSGCSIHETWRAMEALVSDGLVKSIGVSNFSSVQLADLMTYAKILPSVNQIECHPFLQQHNLRAMCAQYNICIVSYSPLGRPGNIEENEPKLLEHEVVLGIAKDKGLSPAQVLLQWQFLNGLAAIPKSTKISHMKENFDCMKVQISPTDVHAIDNIGLMHRFCNKLWCAGAYVFD